MPFINSEGERLLNTRHLKHKRFQSGLVPSSASENSDDDSDFGQQHRVRVDYYANERTLKERLQLYFVNNRRSSLRIRVFNLAIKLLSCLLYFIRVCLEHDEEGDYKQFCFNKTFGAGITQELFQEQGSPICWERIFWVKRHPAICAIQITVAIVSLTETLLVCYLSYKGNILQQVLHWSFLLEVLNTVPFIVIIPFFNTSRVRDIFIPVFLNCWLAKAILESMLNDLHRVMLKSQSALMHHVVILFMTIFCLIFTSCCFIQHLQRGGHQQLNPFSAFWFIIVTFSTVGYGDICPDIWPSQLLIIIMICSALVVLPSQLEQLAFTWLERKKSGSAYSSHRAHNERHVVVCATSLSADTMLDFLNEFYAHHSLQEFYVVLLSPTDLDTTLRMILQVPLWQQRVIYIQGSALKDTDLARCRMQDALACFILAARNYKDRNAADQHTILRSWAVKDFAPKCPQYVQIFRPENKFHVKFAEHVVCEDEFKYAVLANNCLVPGISTLVTLLLHTSRGREGQASPEDWQKLYGRFSGNEVYHIVLEHSKFFSEYKGKSFTFASFQAHRKFGVCLVGVKNEHKNRLILLNPGPSYIMEASDTCYYLAITKEEHSTLLTDNGTEKPAVVNGNAQNETSGQTEANNQTTTGIARSRFASVVESVGTVALELQRTRSANASSGRTSPRRKISSSTSPIKPANGLQPESNYCHHQPENNDLLLQSVTSRRPSIAPVPDMAVCLIPPNPRIQVDEASDHSSDSDDSPDTPKKPVPNSSPLHNRRVSATYSRFYMKGYPPVTPYIGTSPIVCHLTTDKRAGCCLQIAKPCEHCSAVNAKGYHWSSPAVIVCSDYASNGLYNFIVPLRSYSHGVRSLKPIVLLLERPLDDLLTAGITSADHVVVVNKEASNAGDEEITLADCNTIVSVQTMFRLFPGANIITELSHSSNMRFMQFRAKDKYALNLSKLEKKEKERGSNISYMFRLPFAAGHVFSASMLDTLLYQTFVKSYLVDFVRLLLGIDESRGSGHLCSMKITKKDLWIRTYGRLYQKLCSTTAELPIGIYRTEHQKVRQHTETNRRAWLSFKNLPGRRSSFRSSTKRESQPSFKQKRHSSVKEPPKESEMEGSRENSLDSQAPPSPGLLDELSLAVDESTVRKLQNIERKEIVQLVHCTMERLSLPWIDYDCSPTTRDTLSYVIINPSFDLTLQEGDIIYIIRPSNLAFESPTAPMFADDQALKPSAANDQIPDTQSTPNLPSLVIQGPSPDNTPCSSPRPSTNNLAEANAQNMFSNSVPVDVRAPQADKEKADVAINVDSVDICL